MNKFIFGLLLLLSSVSLHAQMRMSVNFSMLVDTIRVRHYAFDERSLELGVHALKVPVRFNDEVIIDRKMLDTLNDGLTQVIGIDYAYTQYKDKKILTYCTGGIKCEKASALLLHEGFKEVYQLHGGIVKYGKEAGGKDFEGKCYVFDNRLAVDVNSINPSVVSTCRNCGITTPKMINCANPECNEHFTQCDDCGEKLQGSCSDQCMTHPRKRTYNGTGYYVKIPQ